MVLQVWKIGRCSALVFGPYSVSYERSRSIRRWVLHEMSAQCCRGFRAANRPRSAVVLVLEAARSYVGEGSWDLAEGLLLDVYARVLNDAWPLLVQDVYDLLLRCYTVLVQKSRGAERFLTLDGRAVLTD